MVSVNGVACHEHGCPNRNLTWNEEYGRFIATRECAECGAVIELGEVCSCAEPIEDEPARSCLIDGSWGIYVPERFARWAQSQTGFVILHVTPADLDELARGPDIEGYWDLWDEIRRDAVLLDNHTGTRYWLEQDSDLFIERKHSHEQHN
jgi:hypothetical protein